VSILFLFFYLFTYSQADTLVIVYTSNIEEGLEEGTATWINPYFPPPIGGRELAEKVIREIAETSQDKGYPVLLLDSGGLLRNNILCDSEDLKAMASYINAVDYNAITLGINDLCMGRRGINILKTHIASPIVLSNLTVEEGTSDESFKEYVVKDIGGLRIGIFGLISEYGTIYLTKEAQKGLTFERELSSAERVMRKLKGEGVDIIVLLSQMGFEHEKRIAREIPGIDIVIGGGDGPGLKEPYEDPVNHTIIVRTYSGLTEVGLLRIFYDGDSNTMVGYSGETITLFRESISP